MELFCRTQSKNSIYRSNRNKDVFSIFLCPKSGFTNLTTDILGQITLCWGAILCRVGCWPSTMAPEWYYTVIKYHPTPNQALTVKSVSSHFQIYPGWQNPPPWGITPLNRWFLTQSHPWVYLLFLKKCLSPSLALLTQHFWYTTWWGHFKD